MIAKALTEDMLDLPLTGVRVIDLATGPLAAIGRHLVELGADVVRIEAPGGTAERAATPAVAGISLDFAAANLGKRAVGLDLADTSGRAAFERLLGAADILIENTAPGSQEWRRLNASDLHRRFPELVILSASDFGQSGSMSGWQATGPVFHALSGELSRSGIPGRAPLLPPGDLAHACAVPQAAFAILLAYFNRLRTGLGDHLDLALLTAAAQALDPGHGMAGSAAAGLAPAQAPRGRIEARFQYPILPCADGYVRICVLNPRQWQGMFQWMGRPAEFADPSFSTLQRRFSSTTLLPAITRFFAGQTCAELEAGGQRHGVPTTSVLGLEQVLATDHVRAREALAQLELAPGVVASFPNGVMEIDGLRAGVRGGPPQLEAPGAVQWHRPRFTAPRSAVGAGRPLSGVRVLNLGVIVVGGEQGRLLADQGADVVKVENPSFPDGSRQTRDGGLMSLSFAAGNRNQRSLSLDLRDPAGKAIFLKLAAEADVILSNFKPGTLNSLGLGAATLAAANPRLIMVDSSAFGPTGPWSPRLGYGPLVRAAAGLTAQWCYPGEPASFSDALTVYPDHVAARIGIVGVLALLIRRLRTGRGGTISVAQAEVMLNHAAPQIAAISLAQKGEEVASAPAHDAPWGVFPCAGDDEWCVVTLRDDDDWQALCTVIARPDLAADPALATRAGRDAARAEIDAALTAWLVERNPVAAMRQLQAAGVPAGAMLRVAELPDFPYFREQDCYRPASHPQIAGSFFLEKAFVGSERFPDPPDRPAPVCGEHSNAVLQEWLGLSPAEIARMVDSKVVGTAVAPAPVG